MFGNCVRKHGYNHGPERLFQSCIPTSMCLTLSGGFDLEHIYKDQSPESFVSKEIKPGIARSFVENIHDWVEKVKSVAPIN